MRGKLAKKDGRGVDRTAVCVTVWLAERPAVMRQTNELAFLRAGHMCEADRDRGKQINQQQK